MKGNDNNTVGGTASGNKEQESNERGDNHNAEAEEQEDHGNTEGHGNMDGAMEGDSKNHDEAAAEAPDNHHETQETEQGDMEVRDVREADQEYRVRKWWPAGAVLGSCTSQFLFEL